MRNAFFVNVISFLIPMLPSLGLANEPSHQPIVDIPISIHFIATDGNDLVVAPGAYRVERGTEPNLKLTRESDQQAIEIQAGSTTYGDVLEAPTALLIAEEGENDEIHLVLLSPDGEDRDAIGTLSGTRARGTRYLGKQQTGYAYAMAQYPRPQSSSPASSFIRVPQASAPTTMQPPSTQAGQDREDTGFVPAPVGSATPVTWSYLRMHAPEQIVSVLKKVQIGALKATALEGLAGPEQVQSLLARPYPDLPTTAIQQGVMSRGLDLVGPPSSAASTFMRPLPSSPSPPPIGSNPPPGVVTKPSGQISAMTEPTGWTGLISGNLNRDVIAPTQADFSPRQADFGSIWDGQAPRAEIRIIVPHDSGITLSLGQNRPFRIVKAFTATGFMKLIRATPTRATLVEQEPTTTLTQPPWNLSARAGQDLWVVIEFAPRTALVGGDSAGRYQTALHVSGYKWTASVPLVGYFNGVKIGVIPMLESHDVHVINPFHSNPNQCAVEIPQSLKLLNATQTPQAVVVEPANFPGNFSMPLVSVTVPPGGTQQVALPIILHCLNDMWSRNFELPVKIRYAGQERQTSFTLAVYPYMYRVPTQGTVGSCKYTAEFWTYPDGNFHLTVTASTSAVWQREFDYAFYFRGMKVAALQLYLDGVAQLGTGVQKSYGFRQPGLEANYMQLFAEKPDIRLRCVSR